MNNIPRDNVSSLALDQQIIAGVGFKENEFIEIMSMWDGYSNGIKYRF